MTRLVLLLSFALSGCASAPAPDVAAAPATCTAAAPLPGEFSAWQTARAVTSATASERLDQARFAVGEAVDLTLHPDGEVAYATLPQGAGEAESFGGLAQFRVETAGTYKVGMSAAAWVDVSRAGQPTPPVAFGPGPRCTPVRKVVSFALQPGDYTLEISGNETADITVMVTPDPTG